MSVACGGVRPSQLYALIQKRDCSLFRVGHPYKTAVSAEKSDVEIIPIPGCWINGLTDLPFFVNLIKYYG